MAPSISSDIDPFWVEQRAQFLAEKSTNADPSACGTCRSLAEAGKPVEHDECAQRATLLHAPDHPHYEILAGFSLEENAKLPARFHVPVFDDCGVPNSWLCAVCQEEGVVTGWPCATATKYGTQVFTPLHEAETAQAKQQVTVSELRAELAAVRAERAELEARARRVAVSHQHFIDDHSDPGTEALAAQYELVTHLSARDGEMELPLNPTENALRVVLALLEQYDDETTPDEIRATLAHALPREDLSDRRRRIYIDGKGGAWIDASVDVTTGERDVAGITDPWKVKAAADVRTETGLLREIGRCW